MAARCNEEFLKPELDIFANKPSSLENTPIFQLGKSETKHNQK